MVRRYDEVVDLAHRLDIDDGEWLEAVGSAVAGIVGTSAWGVSVGAFTPQVKLLAVAGTLGPAHPAWELARALDATSNLYLAQQGLGFDMNDLEDAPTKIGPARFEAIARMVDALGFRHAFCWAALDPRGEGVVLDVDLPRRSRPLEAAVSALMLHVGGAVRLRMALDRAAEVPTEAVLSADGAKVLHAEGIALDAQHREALQRAVAAIERARTRKKSAIDELLARQVLVSGRWFLVDEHQRGSQRYVVARVNEPTTPTRLFPDLSSRQEQIALYLALGHSAKQIAYDLGLSAATVSRDLGRVRRLLAVSSNAVLVAAISARIRQIVDGAP